MRLSSQSSQFSFNLSSDFLPPEIIKGYKSLLEKNWVQYENVIDYLSSTIKSINFPGMSIETPNQPIIRGKKIAYKPATNINDIVTSNELQVTFRSVDSDLNYWLLVEIFAKHYLDTEHQYLQPFIVSALDIHRDAIYQILFKELIFKTIGDNNFDHSAQKIQAKEFTCTFIWNFYEIEFLLNKTKVLELGGSLPIIIQKI